MAINRNGLPIVPGARTLVSGGPPIALNNEIRGGIHRISGETGDTLQDIDGRYLQAGMLVYNEMDGEHYEYVHDGDAPDNPPDANDPYRNAAGELPNGTANWRIFTATVPGGSGPLAAFSAPTGTRTPFRNAITAPTSTTLQWTPNFTIPAGAAFPPGGGAVSGDFYYRREIEGDRSRRNVGVYQFDGGSWNPYHFETDEIERDKLSRNFFRPTLIPGKNTNTTAPRVDTASFVADVNTQTATFNFVDSAGTAVMLSNDEVRAGSYIGFSVNLTDAPTVIYRVVEGPAVGVPSSSLTVAYEVNFAESAADTLASFNLPSPAILYVDNHGIDEPSNAAFVNNLLNGFVSGTSYPVGSLVTGINGDDDGNNPNNNIYRAITTAVTNPVGGQNRDEQWQQISTPPDSVDALDQVARQHEDSRLLTQLRDVDPIIPSTSVDIPEIQSTLTTDTGDILFYTDSRDGTDHTVNTSAVFWERSGGPVSINNRSVAGVLLLKLRSNLTGQGFNAPGAQTRAEYFSSYAPILTTVIGQENPLNTRNYLWRGIVSNIIADAGPSDDITIPILGTVPTRFRGFDSNLDAVIAILIDADDVSEFIYNPHRWLRSGPQNTPTDTENLYYLIDEANDVESVPLFENALRTITEGTVEPGGILIYNDTDNQWEISHMTGNVAGQDIFPRRVYPGSTARAADVEGHHLSISQHVSGIGARVGATQRNSEFSLNNAPWPDMVSVDNASQGRFSIFPDQETYDAITADLTQPFYFNVLDIDILDTGFVREGIPVGGRVDLLPIAPINFPNVYMVNVTVPATPSAPRELQLQSTSDRDMMVAVFDPDDRGAITFRRMALAELSTNTTVVGNRNITYSFHRTVDAMGTTIPFVERGMVIKDNAGNSPIMHIEHHTNRTHFTTTPMVVGDELTTVERVNELVRGGGASPDFIHLTDTPTSYAGSAGFAVTVNSTQNGLGFTELQETARDFNANQFYERGDLVTTLQAGTPNVYAIWVLDFPELNGRSTPIPEADHPGGANNRWLNTEDADELTPNELRTIRSSTPPTDDSQNVIEQTLYGHGYLLSTGSSVTPGSAISEAGDVTLSDLFGDGTTGEWIVAEGGNDTDFLYTVNTDAAEGVDFNAVDVGQPLILTTSAASIASPARSTVQAGFLPAGSYLIYKARVPSRPGIISWRSESMRRINADGTIQSRAPRDGLIPTESTFSLLFAENSLTFSTVALRSNYTISAPGHRSELTLDDDGLHITEDLHINNFTFDSEVLVNYSTSNAANIGSQYPPSLPLAGGSYTVTVVDADFNSIAQGAPLVMAVSTASTQGLIPVGDYLVYRADAPGGSPDRSISIDGSRLFPIRRDNSIGPNAAFGVSINFPAIGNYAFRPATVDNSLDVTTPGGGTVGFRDDGLFFNSVKTVTADENYIPVYFTLTSPMTGEPLAENLSLRPASTDTHYALVRQDSYGLGFDVFNADGTLTTDAASSLNTLRDNEFVVFIPVLEGGITAADVSALSGINWPTDNTPQINSVNVTTTAVTDELRTELNEEHNTNVTQNSALATQRSAIDLNSHRIDLIEGRGTTGGGRYHTHQFFTVEAPQRTATELLDYRSRATGTTTFQWAEELYTGAAMTAGFTADSTVIPSNISTLLNNHLRGVYHNNSGLASYSLANASTTFIDWNSSFISPVAIVTINSTIRFPVTVVNNFRQGTFSHHLMYPFPVDANLSVTNVGVRYFTADTNWTYTLGGSSATNPLVFDALTIPLTPTQVTDLMARELAGDTLVVHWQRQGETTVRTNVIEAIGLTNGTGASNVSTAFQYVDLDLLNADGTPLAPSPAAPLLSEPGTEISVTDQTTLVNTSALDYLILDDETPSGIRRIVMENSSNIEVVSGTFTQGAKAGPPGGNSQLALDAVGQTTLSFGYTPASDLPAFTAGEQLILLADPDVVGNPPSLVGSYLVTVAMDQSTAATGSVLLDNTIRLLDLAGTPGPVQTITASPTGFYELFRTVRGTGGTDGSINIVANDLTFGNVSVVPTINLSRADIILSRLRTDQTVTNQVTGNSYLVYDVSNRGGLPDGSTFITRELTSTEERFIRGLDASAGPFLTHVY